MARKFRVLRNLLDDHDMDQVDLAKKLSKSSTWVSRVLNGRSSPTIEQGYKILDLFGIPYEDFHKVFPKSGITATQPNVPIIRAV